MGALLAGQRNNLAASASSLLVPLFRHPHRSIRELRPLYRNGVSFPIPKGRSTTVH